MVMPRGTKAPNDCPADPRKRKVMVSSVKLAVAENPYNSTLHQSVAQDHGLADALDNLLIAECAPALEDGRRVEFASAISNVNRSVGTMLGSRVTRKWGGNGLTDDTITLRFRGSAGQSFGAFVPRGITMHLEGD
ncbi:MAG: hypothetical protein EB005_02505, partial [Actinobacteria bacterium]|nr:hypothetical protein [Actinomycetota bacterium]